MRSEAEFELALRQQLLLSRSAALRDAAAAQVQVLGPPLATLDRARAVAAWLYERRVWIGAAAVLVLVVRPRRAWRVARWGWWLWRTARRVLPWLTAAGVTPESIHRHGGRRWAR
jgi:hypothetical protein